MRWSLLQWLVATTALAGLPFGAAQAQAMYKCTDARGVSSFSDRPCESNTKAETFRPQSNSLDTTGQREQTLLRENQQLRERLQQQDVRQPQAKAAGSTEADLQKELIGSEECLAAKRSYEIAAGSIKPVQSVVQARSSVMYGACGMREPDNTVIVVPQTKRQRRDAEDARDAEYGTGEVRRMGSCNQFSCRDDKGMTYQVGPLGDLTRQDGRRCRTVGRDLYC